MSLAPSNANFRVDIQGMRGIAVLLVVLYHAGLPVPGGFIGVDVFFVLSGFVITEGMLRGLESGTFSFAEFYRKRVRRLLPALALMTTVVLATAWFLGPIAGQYRTGRTGVAATLLNANHYLMLGNSYFDPSTEYVALLHTWSLSVEEQFYLVFPLVTVLLWRLGRKSGRPRLLGAGLVVFSLLSLVLCVWLSFKGSVLGIPGLKFAFFSAITRSWEFGIGALLAVASPWIRAQNAWVGRLGWVGLAMVLLSSFAFSEATVFPGYSALLPAFGTGFLLLSGFFGVESLLVRALSMRWLVRLGDLSYSWYLWHWPLIVFAAACFPQDSSRAMVIAAVASLGVAWASERFWETPIRFRPMAQQWLVGAVGALCVVVPLFVFVVQDSIVDGLRMSSRLERRAIDSLGMEAYALWEAYNRIPCDTGEVWPAVSKECMESEAGRDTMVLVGDSNARQFYQSFSYVANSNGLNWGVATLSSCPFIEGNTNEILGVSERCARWTNAQIEMIELHRPTLVVIAGAWDVYIKTVNLSLAGSAAVMSHDASRTEDVLIESLQRTILRVSRTGAKVIVVDPIPKFEDIRNEAAGPYRCSLAVLEFFAPKCELQVAKGLGAKWAAFMKELEETPSVRVLDLKAELCQNSRCSAFLPSGARVAYYDAEHLSPAASVLVIPPMERLVRTVLGR